MTIGSHPFLFNIRHWRIFVNRYHPSFDQFSERLFGQSFGSFKEETDIF
jgi:hypothetical protein